MKKEMLVVVMLCVVGCAGTGGCDLEDVKKGRYIEIKKC